LECERGVFKNFEGSTTTGDLLKKENRWPQAHRRVGKREF